MLARIQHGAADIGVGQGHGKVDDDFNIIAFEQLVHAHGGDVELLAACLGRGGAHVSDGT